MTPYTPEQAAAWLDLLGGEKKSAAKLLGVSRPRFDKILEQGASDTESYAMKWLEEERVRAMKLERKLSSSEAIKTAFHEVEAFHNSPKMHMGAYATCYRNPNGQLTLPHSSLVLVTGPPQVGKSSLIRGLAMDAALEHGKNVCVITLKETTSDVAFRMICNRAKIPIGNLRRGVLREHQWAQLIKAGGELSEAPMVMLDKVWPLDDIEKQVRALHATSPLDFLMIDSLNMIDVPGSQSRYEELSRVSRTLKKLAMELGIIIVAGARANRKVDHRHDARPKLSDLRDSGHLEYDASMIIALYREEIHDPESQQRGLAELHVLKHPDGQLQVVRLRFFALYTLFENIDEERFESLPPLA